MKSNEITNDPKALKKEYEMKLQVYQSYWGMAGLPFNSEIEWTMEEKLSSIAEAGFDGVEFLMEEKVKPKLEL